MIKEIRRSAGLSHKNLAAWLGVSTSMVQFAEHGGRNLIVNASKKLGLLAPAMQQVQDAAKKDAAKKKLPANTITYTDPGAFAKKHAIKMEHHQYQAGKLQRQLNKLLQQHVKLTAGIALLDAMKNIDAGLPGNTKRDKHLTGLLEFFEQDKMERVNKQMEMLQDSIAMHLGYAEVHERKLEEFKLMKKKI